MSYQALYRKYRPSTLEDVIGQDVIIKILKNAVTNDRIGHAYLFSGPRGIGKTSIAKLVAKTVNCLNPNNGSPCEKCENCLAINSGFNADIIEIDAASNNGVDEIREIKNKINLVPNQLKYKVYIIDEVHMLSIGAFNALLKTLEEPPEYIIFILATTDPQKVPATIVSRCQCFEFHRISSGDIVKRLNYICKEEKISIDDNVLEKIAILSDGGLRDAIGMLDKLNAYSNSKITLEDFEKVNGIVSLDDKNRFIDYLSQKNAVEIIKFIDNIYDSGKDLIIFTQDLLEIVKNKIISYYIENDTSMNINFLLDLSNMLNDLIKNIKSSTNVKTLLEINMLSFINKNTEIIDESPKIVEKVQVSDKKIEKEPQIVEKSEVKEEKNETNIDYDEINSLIINNSFARANKQNKQLFENKWKELENYALDSTYGAIASSISDGTIRVVGEAEVILSFKYDSMVSRGLSLINKIEELITKIYGKHYDIAIISDEKWNSVKKDYINNKNNGIEYKYTEIPRIEEKKVITDDDSITSQAMELFGNDVVSVG